MFLARELGLVEEDAAEVVAVREDLVLQGQEGPAGVHEVDAGQVVLQRDVLGAQVLLDRERIVGAAFDRGVVGDDHDVASVDHADAGDQAGGLGRVGRIDVMGGEAGELEKRGIGVEEEFQALADQELLAGFVEVAGGLGAAELGFFGEGAELLDYAAVVLGVLLELGAVDVDLGSELIHGTG